MAKRKGNRRPGKRRRKSAVTLKIERDNKLNKRGYTKRFLLLRNRVLLRDEFTCQFKLCKNPKGVKCQVHHIVKYSASKILRNNKFNLVTICNRCAVEHINGREKRYEASFKNIARRNESRFSKIKKTKEDIMKELKEHQKLPSGFEGYKYLTEEEVTKKKYEESQRRKLWRMIKFRTQNKNSNSYRNYGGRGITMYSEWINNYELFELYLNEHLGERPEDASIDRIDNNKGYEPGNIQWATAEEQGQNRRTNILNEELVSVIIILHYKYKMKISQIVDKLSLPSRACVNGVLHGNTWTNISNKYISIIDNEKVIAKIKNKHGG